MWCDSCGRRLRCAPLALCANGEGSIIHERPSVTHVWTGLRREPVRLRSASHWRARVAALKAADTPHLLWPTAAATAAAATATATATAKVASCTEAARGARSAGSLFQGLGLKREGKATNHAREAHFDQAFTRETNRSNGTVRFLGRAQGATGFPHAKRGAARTSMSVVKKKTMK